jgi:hypothetical protein
MRWLLIGLVLLASGCRESSIACDIVRSFADSRGRFTIEDAREIPLLQACLLREQMEQQAREALQPPDPQDPDEPSAPAE